MASRCGWIRMGLRRSLTRDSAMSVDSLYSSLASSCRRKWVDFLTLQKESSRGRRASEVSCTVIPICLAILIMWIANWCENPAYIQPSNTSYQATEKEVLPAALCQWHQNGHLVMGVLSKARATDRSMDGFWLVSVLCVILCSFLHFHKYVHTFVNLMSYSWKAWFNC